MRRIVLSARVFLASSVFVLPTLLIGACALTTSGCGTSAAYKETRNLTAPHVPGSGLNVQTVNGSIAVEASGAGVPSEVAIEATLRAETAERLRAIVVLADRQADGRLMIDVRWPDGRRGSNEGCSFKVRLPDASGVVLDTSNGSIRAAGLSGTLRVDTSNGSVNVDRHSGDVELSTSNGSIVVTDAAGRVSADTSNGSVRVTMAETSAGPVDIDTSNGSVELAVGSAFAGSLDVGTSNGRVTVQLPTGIRSVNTGKSEAKIEFQAPGGRSVVDTSNGSVTIRRREPGPASESPSPAAGASAG